jgi:holliday junction DNA helicase RuvA
MISYLEGDIELKRATGVIIKVGGVGYKVSVTPVFLDNLHVGEFAKMYIFTQVREDILALYGFQTVEELELFELLLTVSGIGPRAALGVLSATSVENIKNSIASQDPTIISSVSGVGKKTAEKVVLELKNKVTGVGDNYNDLGGAKSEDVYLALINLGFKPQEARLAISNLPKDCTKTEDKLKHCLANIKKG